MTWLPTRLSMQVRTVPDQRLACCVFRSPSGVGREFSSSSLQTTRSVRNKSPLCFIRFKLIFFSLIRLVVLAPIGNIRAWNLAKCHVVHKTDYYLFLRRPAQHRLSLPRPGDSEDYNLGLANGERLKYTFVSSICDN